MWWAGSVAACGITGSGAIRAAARSPSRKLAHGLAAETAERAALVTGQRLSYQAFDTSTGAIEGAARALAGG